MATCGRSLRFTFSPVQIAAAIAIAGAAICFTIANKFTTAANAILLQYTSPMWIGLFGAWLLGERTARSDWLTIAAVFTGMGIFLYDGLRLNDLTGILVGILSGLFFAASVMLLRKQKEGSPIESIILGNLLCFLVAIPAIWAAPPLTGGTTAALLALGVAQLGLAWLAYSHAIKHVTALESVIIPIIEPVLNPVWVMLVVGERPSPLALLGGALVVGAVTWRGLYSVKKRQVS